MYRVIHPSFKSTPFVEPNESFHTSNRFPMWTVSNIHLNLRMQSVFAKYDLGCNF